MTSKQAPARSGEPSRIQTDRVFREARETRARYSLRAGLAFVAQVIAGLLAVWLGGYMIEGWTTPSITAATLIWVVAFLVFMGALSSLDELLRWRAEVATLDDKIRAAAKAGQEVGP